MAVRAVTNAGSGRGGADHGGFAVLPDAPGKAVDLLWRWALEWRPDHSLLLANLSRDSAITRLAAESLRPVDSEECPLVRIPPGASFDDVRSSWTKNRRKTIGKRQREFAAAGGRFEWLSDPKDVGRALPHVFALHARRRDELGLTTTFGADAESRAFHNQLAASSDEVSGCWVQLAQVGSDVVGGLYGFRLGTTYSVYQSGWDPAWSASSLGLVQYAEALHQVVDAGGTTFDMCRGADPYKLRFANEVAIEHSYARLRGISGLLLSARWTARRARRRRTSTRPQTVDEG